MGDFPLGFKYRFAPEDHELITYLSCKAKGEPLPSEEVIQDVNLYDMNDPGKLFRGSQENIVYVFTKVKKVAENGKRVDRKVAGNRTWKGVDKGQPIYDKEGRLVGEKRNFNFMNKMKVKLQFNMTEFVLDKESLCRAKFKDYVLCQIKKKVKKGKSAQEEAIGSPQSAMEEEVNSYMLANSLVIEAPIPFPESVSEQYFSQNLPECKKESAVNYLPQWLRLATPRRLRNCSEHLLIGQITCFRDLLKIRKKKLNTVMILKSGT